MNEITLDVYRISELFKACSTAQVISCILLSPTTQTVDNLVRGFVNDCW